MRIQRILVGAALLMLCAAAAYAQVTISSTPVTQVIASGKAEVAGTVRITAQAATVADTFTIRYGGLAIANGAATGALAVQIVNGGWDVAPTIANIEAGIITLNVPATAALGDYFEVSNVRLDISGLAGPASVSAQLGTLVTPIVAGQTFAIVINNIGAGLTAAAEDDDDSPATLTANGNILEDNSTWVLTEGFASAWKNLAQAGGATATNGVDILLTMDELPVGLEMCVEGVSVDGGGTAATSGDSCFNEDNDQVLITFSDTNQSEVNELILSLHVHVDQDEVPYDSAIYRIKATLAPTTGTTYPKFAAINLPTEGFPALYVVPSTTNFILPYLISDTTMGYNTGIAIANTTKDPYGDDGAIPQDGTVTVTFYGNDGTTVTYDSATDAVKGSGLSAAGVLRSGYTWTVLASELLAAKNRTTPLTGYAIIVLNVTNGHGSSFISNFSGFTSGSPLLVIRPPAVADRDQLNTELTVN